LIYINNTGGDFNNNETIEASILKIRKMGAFCTVYREIKLNLGETIYLKIIQ